MVVEAETVDVRSLRGILKPKHKGVTVEAMNVAQSGRAAKLVSKAIDRSEQLFVSDIVMCEGEHARTAGCERVATFDRALTRPRSP